MRRKEFIKGIIENKQLYVFMILPLVYVIMFRYVPMVGVQIAFKDFNVTQGIWGSPWTGFENFTRFFQSYQFTRVIANTILLSFYSLIAGFPMPIIFALCLNALRSQRFKKFSQMLTYIPHFISVVVLVSIVMQMLNPVLGVFGVVYTAIFNKTAPDLMAMPSAFPHVYVWSGIWQNMGWGTIIYMAALSNVDPELHEAAEIDGASRFRRCLHIDFPTILPTTVIMLILRSGNIMSVGFEKTFLMQNNLNLRSSEVISTYVYKVGLVTGGGNFSYASAIGLFNSVINLLMIVFVNQISKKVSETSLW